MRFSALAIGALAIGALALAFAAPALADDASAGNLFANPSFETPVVPDGLLHAFHKGDRIGPWKVTGGSGGSVFLTSTDLRRGFYTYDAEDGNQWLNLDGRGSRMTVTQRISVVPGLNYTLSFWVGAIGNPKKNTTTVHVTFDGVEQYTCTFQAKKRKAKTQQWHLCTYGFVAEPNPKGKLVVGFQNGDTRKDPDCGLDQVSLTVAQ